MPRIQTRERVVSAIAILAAVPLCAQRVPADWQQVGKAGEWAETVAMVAMKGFIWSIESNGTLFKTDPRGNYQQVGPKGSFLHVTMIEALDGLLYTVEGGTLYQTNPETGSWRQLGEKGAWGDTAALAGLGGSCGASTTMGRFSGRINEGAMSRSEGKPPLVTHICWPQWTGSCGPLWRERSIALT
jgi:hypothetical protein